jgi:hypothetical protein
MQLPHDYDPELLIDAVTALDWSAEHPSDAVRAIQAIVQSKFGEELSDDDALQLLGYLLDRRLIRTQIHPDSQELVGWQSVRRRAKYVRVPPGER